MEFLRLREFKGHQSNVLIFHMRKLKSKLKTLHQEAMPADSKSSVLSLQQGQ